MKPKTLSTGTVNPGTPAITAGSAVATVLGYDPAPQLSITVPTHSECQM